MILPKKILQKVSQIDNIATLPEVAIRVLEKIRDYDSNLPAIAKIIEKDTSISTRLLKVANSPFWGFSGKIDSIQRSLILLGLKEVFNIVIAVSLFSTFGRLKPNPFFNREKFWFHSAGCAQVAKLITKKVQLQFRGEEFLATLIQNIGTLILDQFLKEEFEKILHNINQSKKPLIEVEENILGCNHAHIGSWLLEHWHFPESIFTAVQYHHHPQATPDDQLLASVIYLSDHLFEAWTTSPEEEYIEKSVHTEAAWNILKYKNPRLYDLNFDEFQLELKQEIESAHTFIQLIAD